MTGKCLVVSVHDVAPTTWERTRDILDQLDAVGISQRSLLVIPNYRGREPVSENPGFLNWLRDRQGENDEVILHGYEHVGVGEPRTFTQRLQSRWQTQGEGEFLMLNYFEARRRIRTGMKMLHDASIEVNGFVAPAWLINHDGLEAAADLGFQYTNSYWNVLDLRTRNHYFAPSLVFGPGALNEDLGVAMQSVLSKALERSSVVRVVLHPPCVERPSRFGRILAMIQSQLASHEPITYSQLLKRCQGRPMTSRTGDFLIAAVLALCIGVAPLISAQTVNVNLFETHFTVTDRNGEFVPNLTKSDFTIFDDDTREDVAEFEQSRNTPLSIALILDRSTSVSDRFRFVVDSASTFIKSVVREPDDQALAVAFDSKVYLLHDWSKDGSAVIDAMSTLTSAGGTSVFDAIYKTCRDKFDPADSRRKIVVLITDGDDTTSRSSYDQSLQMAQRSGASIYVVGIRAEGSMNTRELQGRRVLTSFADLTGGRIFYPEDDLPRHLDALFQKLQEEMRNEYRIAYYHDAPTDGSFHKIRIEARNRNLDIHAPSGYFAQRRVKAF